MPTTRANKPQQITEKVWMAQFKDLCRTLGWHYYHPYLSIHSEKGFPDCTLVRGERLVFVELKAEKGVVSPKQTEWLDRLRGVPGVEVYVWRPSDWDEACEVLR